MTKRNEVRISDKTGNYWVPAEIIGEDDGQFIVEYKDLLGYKHEVLVDSFHLRSVNAEITDMLLREAADAAVKHIRQHVISIEQEVLDSAGEAALQALRLHFGYPL